MKKIKKYSGMLVLMLVGGVCGFLTVVELESMGAMDMPFWAYMLTLLGMVLALYLAFIIQIIVHEAGHLVCGLLTGYGFSSFRIGSLMLIRQDGKLRLKQFSLAGTGGQCLLVPPNMVDGKIPYVLYNLGGFLTNILAAAIGLALLPLSSKGPLHFFFLLTGVIGIGFALVNGIPMNAGGVSNDGHNARCLGKNPNALRAFWLQMKINEAQAAGVRVKDMPEEWFELPLQEDMGNSLCSAQAVIRTSWHMDRHEFELASQSIDTLLEDSKAGKIEVQGIYQNMMAMDRIFCELIGNGDRAKVDALLTKELQTTMKQMKNMISVIRTQYVLALLYDNKPEKAACLKAAFDKQASKYPYPAEVQSEREFMQMAEEMVKASAAT